MSSHSKKPRKKIALFGGAFNPPHEGHIGCAKAIHDELGVDEVWMLVTPLDSYKKRRHFASFEHRMNMATIAAQRYPWLKVTDIEKEFFTGQTIDTLRGLRFMFPDTDFYWVMGADNLTGFHTWKQADDIMNEFPVLVISRPGQDEEALKSETARNHADKLVFDVENMKNFKTGFLFLKINPVAFQSSQIAQALEKRQRNIPGLDPAVRRYITKNGLYQAPRKDKKPTP